MKITKAETLESRKMFKKIILLTILVFFLSQAGAEEPDGENNFTSLRRYRQHFASISSWTVYHPFYNPFKAKFLLLSGDRHNKIFISDALTGEVFREFDAFFPQKIISDDQVAGLFDFDDEKLIREYERRSPESLATVNERASVRCLLFSPRARLIAYCDGGCADDKDISELSLTVGVDIHVIDSLTGLHIGRESCGQLLSLAFRYEPINDCDILLVISLDHGKITRRYYSFSPDILDQKGKLGLLSNFELDDADSIFRELDTTDFEIFSPSESFSSMKSDDDCRVGLEKAIEKTRKSDIELMESIRRSGGFVVKGGSPEQKTSESDAISGENPEAEQIDTKESVDEPVEE